MGIARAGFGSLGLFASAAYAKKLTNAGCDRYQSVLEHRKPLRATSVRQSKAYEA